MNTVKSNHTVDDIKKIAPILTTSEMLVRVNPWNESSKKEINDVIDAGAQLVMLPMWKSVQDVKNFIITINKRVKTVLLLETKEAVECLDDVLKLDGIDEIHIGLNDLHLSYGLTFMFELLSNGVVENICNKIKKAGIPYGFGGIAKLGYGDLPAEKVIIEHYRLGSTRAILSRSFCNTSLITEINEIEDIFKENMESLRNFEQQVKNMTEEEIKKNANDVKKIVTSIIKKKRTINDKEKLAIIKEKCGDTFYILDTKQFRSNFIELKNAFDLYYPKFNIAYSYKTNYIPKLCKIVNELNGYAEVVSEMELQLALKVGVNPKKIIWNGPIKKADYLKKYAFDGITINIDNYDEALFINDISNKEKKNINVGIRCNYDIKDGVISRFGLDVNGDDFKKTLDIINNNEYLYLVNLQCHFANRKLEYWPNRVKGMIETIEKINIIPDRIDLGGGLYGKMDERLKNQYDTLIPSYKEYAESVAPILYNYFSTKNKFPELIIEPGSALVGDCMKFICSVCSIKNIRGKYYATLTGSQKNISMAGINPPIDVVNFSDNTKKYENIDLVGYTCIENDVIYKNYNGNIAVGDVVIINNCGSYSIVMKPPFILPNVDVVELNNNEIEFTKNKETFDNIFETYNF